MSSIKEFQHLKISLEVLESATNNFSEINCIGRGGFGKVYKGEILLSGVLTTVAIKRLDTSFGQGTTEFWKEIMLLSQYKHENLVSLLGFCDEGREKLLVYEYLSRKSLDLYLDSVELSWHQRLMICLGAAIGLQYLHEPVQGSQQRVLHRDIKSANILLDHNWTPKIADFGLSKLGPANQQYTFLFSNAVGTMGYCDPLYAHAGLLTKESDVYSFGVVLFEVLCGRPCLQSYNGIHSSLSAVSRKCYEEKTMDTIIHNNGLEDNISPMCVERFSAIAYQCLQLDRGERPTMLEVVEGLRWAIHYQSVEGMKVVCHELAAATDDPDGSLTDDLIKDADRIVSGLAARVAKTFDLSLMGASSRSCKYVLSTLMQTFQSKRLAHAVNQTTLENLITELLLWLLDERVRRMDDGTELLKGLNDLILKILDNAERTSSFVVLINLLKPLDPSRWPSPPSTESFASRNKKFSELVVKCLIKITKVLQSTIYEVDLDRILQSIHVYLQELGMEEIRRRAGADDRPLSMIKTILHELVKLRGTAIKGHLSLVPIETKPQPIILAYIDLNLQELDSLRRQIINGSSVSPHQQ